MGFETLKQLEGQDVGTSDWLLVDQDRVNAFADATLDHQWIHIDPAKAASGPFGGTIAHGFLTVSLLPFLGAQVEVPLDDLKMALNYGMDKLRFPSPVLVGSNVRVHRKVLEVTDVGHGGVQVKNLMSIEVEGQEKPACVAETLSRYYF